MAEILSGEQITMVTFIGSAEVSAIQEFNISDGLSVDEIDLAEKDSNIAFLAEDEAMQASFSGTLVENLSVQNKSLEEMRSDVKSVISDDVDFVPVEYNGKKGFMSVESVNVSEESDIPTIRNVTFSGLFLPWPEHFSDVEFETRRQQVLPDIPTFFSISTVTTNSPIVETQRLDVNADIRNEGLSGTKTITLTDTNSEQVDSKDAFIENFSSENVLLQWDTQDGDAGSGNVEISTGQDDRSVSVIIEELIDLFEVDIISTNSPVKEGEELVVNLGVENTGTETGTQNILLKDFVLDVVDQESLTLDGGADDSIDLIWDTELGDRGSGDITVETDDDSDSKEVIIEELLDAFFTVSIISTNSPIEETETLEVSVLIENTGELDDSKEIRLFDFEDNLVDTNNIQIDSGNTEQILMEWETGFGDEGVGNITVETDDDSDSKEVTVEIGGF